MNRQEDCLFCKMVAREVLSTIVYETEDVLGFKDIHPQAPVHLLFIPKTHVSGVEDMTPSHQGLLTSLVLAARHAARESGIADKGYRLVINSREDGGQTVPHLHVHLLGGRRMHWPPG